ncbi:3,4-dihydroxy-2-butanone-4-phosphate synthase [Pseudomonas alliivorans]|uniref:3,4-dihydroxy-2-butanone-4-phosphate synthase n=1 Tax=Pseudomonas alliivorans TaxID=2810613 RepID=UPI0020904949|nr:3,4-dihydroxy-2-butanone-4-phosphate synthase [Pseudomonas alliivorans]MCO5365979.1 3,4-dihydroxy-2-butanone-4-phosphate synthase [Pseudomonas alliivorans]MEE4891783.1 3,4-dihydroxy-2-butanone-4-phosphate synthase [Pseudomonas alliivorans]MEE5072717.1 3,4-dihydroxy-2-butanone-4-phosphate synthase [Pseudomonas alliivorans]MEE5118725.1 3,4-dihydroxy-2-butanone-4-phosphate synthase [Pseudomonas alliivorans]
MYESILAKFPNVLSAVEAYKQGRPVVLMDDHDREDEADLVVAAENMSVQSMAMMIRDGSGIVCLCLDEHTVETLGLKPMVPMNESRFATGFTVSIEAAEGITTGVSAVDRLTTVRAALSSDAFNRRIVSPGHMFPLRARSGGVLERRGHTEGSVEIAIIAGMRPAAVLCELMNPDGTMTRGEQIRIYAEHHSLPILTIAELVDFRQACEELRPSISARHSVYGIAVAV